jgi:cell wall assembly regulator SMI1
METKGIEAWKAEHDDRSEEEKRGASVEGVKRIEKHENHKAP